MSPATRHSKKHAKAKQRRRLKVQERLERDRRQAEWAADALQRALEDLGLPENLVAEIEGRLRSQKKLLGKILGVMCPPLFGCRTNTELCRVRGWDKNLPTRLLGALPKRSWLKRLRRLGLEVLIPLWRHAASASAATQSRWQWTWVGDNSVFKKYGEQLGLVGTWWSGQEHRVLSGIDGVSWWSSSVRANWWSPWILPSVALIRRGLALLVVTSSVGCRACSTGGWRLFAGAASRCPRRWSSPIAGLAIRSSCAMSRRLTRGRSLWKGRVPIPSHCPMGGRSRAMTCGRTAIGRGGRASRCLGSAMRGCGRPVRRMAR